MTLRHPVGVLRGRYDKNSEKLAVQLFYCINWGGKLTLEKFTCQYICIYMYIFTYTHMYVYIYTSICIYINMCVYIEIYVYVYICIYILLRCFTCHDE